MSSTYNRCLIRMMAEHVHAQSNMATAKCFKTKAKQFFGVGNLDGLPDQLQICKMNAFLRHTLEPLPNTTFIRGWLEDSGNMEEYLNLFYRNWCKLVIDTGAFSNG